MHFSLVVKHLVTVGRLSRAINVYHGFGTERYRLALSGASGAVKSKSGRPPAQFFHGRLRLPGRCRHPYNQLPTGSVDWRSEGQILNPLSCRGRRQDDFPTCGEDFKRNRSTLARSPCPVSRIEVRTYFPHKCGRLLARAAELVFIRKSFVVWVTIQVFFAVVQHTCSSRTVSGELDLSSI